MYRVQCSVFEVGVHCSVCSEQGTVYSSIQSGVCSVQCKVFLVGKVYSVKCLVLLVGVQCPVYNVQFTKFSVQCALFLVCTVYSVQCTVYSVPSGWGQGDMPVKCHRELLGGVGSVL